MSNIREEVKWFAEQMESALAAKDDRYDGNSWLYVPDSFVLFSRLLGESDELMEAISSPSMTKEQKIKECADVANFAMMIADRIRNGL